MRKDITIETLMLVKLAPNKILIINPDTKITMSNNGTFLAPKLYIKFRIK